jgi:DNA-binding MarR family transcriptional regulator
MARRSYPQLELDRQLCFALYDASRSVVRAYGPLLADLELTYPQYLAMLVLWEAPEPVSVGALGRRLHLDSGTLTPLLKRLEQRELVVRRRDRHDERRVLVELTTAGRRLRTRAADIPRQAFERYGLDLAEVERLRDDLTRLARSLDPEGTTDGG